MRIACNHVPDYVRGFNSILDEIATVDYVEWRYDEIVREIKPYDIFLPSIGIPLDEAFFLEAPNLKLIATPSTGSDHINLQLAATRGIEVLSLKDDLEFLQTITATAENALTLMLSTLRMIPHAFDSVKRGEWNSAMFRGHSVSGKTLGIIGFGRLGQMMAEYGQGLRMNIVAADPYKTIDCDYVKQVELDELLRSSDVVSIHVHLNADTRGMIGAREMGLMKQSAIIVNTSRGALIDETRLVEMLQNGRIAGAGLDVLESELYADIGHLPIVNYARTHQNVVITPHIGGVTYESQIKAYLRTAEKIRDWILR